MSPHPVPVPIPILHSSATSLQSPRRYWTGKHMAPHHIPSGGTLQHPDIPEHPVHPLFSLVGVGGARIAGQPPGGVHVPWGRGDAAPGAVGGNFTWR